MTMKTPIYSVGLMIALAGFWAGYHAAFVDSDAVPFAQQLFFSHDSGALNLIAPFLCLGFYTSIGNGLAFLTIAVTGQLFGYKIQGEGLGGVTMGLSLVERNTD